MAATSYANYSRICFNAHKTIARSWVLQWDRNTFTVICHNATSKCLFGSKSSDISSVYVYITACFHLKIDSSVDVTSVNFKTQNSPQTQHFRPTRYITIFLRSTQWLQIFKFPKGQIGTLKFEINVVCCVGRVEIQIEGPMLETLDYTIRIGSTPTLKDEYFHTGSLQQTACNKNIQFGIYIHF